MAADKLKSFTVGSNKYFLEPMSADEALNFGVDVMAMITPLAGNIGNVSSEQLQGKAQDDKWLAILGAAAGGFNSARVKSVGFTAMNYVRSPDSILLNTPETRDQWFQDHPEDLYLVMLKAIWSLASDFLPSGLRTFVLGLATKTTKAVTAKSQKDTTNLQPSEANSASQE
jgi:hypothetical protein